MYYAMKHMVFPVRKTCKLTVNCVFPMQVNPETEYSIRLLPFSVAADANRFYGDCRPVKYAYFLRRNDFPEHKRKRNFLGGQMARLASGRAISDTVMLAEIRPSEDFTPLRYEE